MSDTLEQALALVRHQRAEIVTLKNMLGEKVEILSVSDYRRKNQISKVDFAENLGVAMHTLRRWVLKKHIVVNETVYSPVVCIPSIEGGKQ